MNVDTHLPSLLVKAETRKPKIASRQPAGVGASGCLKDDTARNGVMMLQGTKLTVVNAEEEGDTTLVHIMPQEGILPALDKPMFIRLAKEVILLNLSSDSLRKLAFGLNSDF